MTSHDVGLVKQSFEKVLPIAETAAEIFYDRLFEMDPRIRPLFSGDMHEQGQKLMQALAVMVKSLDHFEKILPAVEELARRHATYGVTDEHYATVGQALIFTLEKGLGEAFTADVKEAWLSVYGSLSSVMIQAAKQ